MKKMSKREMYNIIISIMETGESPIPPKDIIDFAKHEIELIDQHNEKSKKYKKNKASANEGLKNIIETCLPDEPEMIDSIVKRVEGASPSQYKVTRSIVIYWLNQLVKEEKATKSKIKGITAYAIA